MQGHLLQKHLQLQQSPGQMRLRTNCKQAWHAHQQRCQHAVNRPSTRLAALPVQPSTAGQQQQHGNQQGSSNKSKLVQLVEVQDRRMTTYSWQDTNGSSSNGSGVTVQHQQQQEEQDERQLLSSLPGRQQLLDALKTLYLPAGYPNTVTGEHCTW
jgi:hypothetical protein